MLQKHIMATFWKFALICTLLCGVIAMVDETVVVQEWDQGDGNLTPPSLDVGLGAVPTDITATAQEQHGRTKEVEVKVTGTAIMTEHVLFQEEKTSSPPDVAAAVKADEGEKEAMTEEEFAGIARHASLFYDVTKVKEENSVNIIASLPVTYYFDIFMGKFRLGVIGSMLDSSHQNMVSKVSRKLKQRGDSVHLDEVPVTDVHTLFMHALRATQALSHQSVAIGNDVDAARASTEWELTEVDAIERLYEEVAGELAVDIRTQAESMLINSRTQAVMRERERAYGDAKMDRLQRRTAGRLQIRNEQQERIMNITLSHLEMIWEIKTSGITELGSIREANHNETASGKLLDLEASHEIELERLKEDIARIMTSTKFQLEEELRYEKETEDVMLKVETAKHEVELAELERFVANAAEEAKRMFLYALDNKVAVIKGLLLILFVIFAAVVVSEAATVARTVYNYLSQSKMAVHYKRGKAPTIGESEIENGSTVASIVADRPTRRVLDTAARSLSKAAEVGAPMSHLLVWGPPGTAKTVAAKAIAHDSGLHYAHVNTADLLGLGDQSSLYLMDLLSRIKQGSSSTVIVLDKVDDVIISRGDAQDTNGFTQSCFYILLQALRESSPRLSVVLTTSLDVSAVDTAVLDRMDVMVEMALPAAVQRHEYSVRLAAKLFAPYLSEDENAKLLAYGKEETVPITYSHRSSGSPETDIPSKVSDGALSSYDDIDTLLADMTASNSHFDAPRCLGVLVRRSCDWSFRDIDRVLNGVVATVLGTHECRVTTKIFVNEVRTTLKERLDM